MSKADDDAGWNARAVGVVAVIALAWTTGCGDDAGRGGKPGGDAAQPDGRALFAQHCAACHGPEGAGDGPAAYLLWPRPRNLASEAFRLVSTTNSVPTDEDLFDVITRGLLGSSMPPHAHLPEADRRALVAEVRRLMFDGRLAVIRAENQAGGGDLDEAAMQRLAKREPGPLYDPPPRLDPTPDVFARGKDLYSRHCASCHDESGAGRGRTDLVDSLGRPTAARDLTLGILKGGTSELEVLRRIALGLPGSPMPSSAATLASDGLWAVTHYTRSLMRSGENERLSQRQTTLVGRKVPAAIDGDPDQQIWSGVPATWIALAPLWWRDDRIDGVEVQVAHDGQRLAFRLVGADATMNVSQARPQDFSDGMAVQLSADRDPPFFAMGVKGRPVEIWYWRASLQADLGGLRDAALVHGTVVNDVDASIKERPAGTQVRQDEVPLSAHDPLYLAGWGAGNPLSAPNRATPVDTLRAEGFGTLSYRAPSPPPPRAAGRGRHADGRWRVVLVRDAGGSGGVSLAPGSEASVGFAAWDGAAGDRDGQKSVSIWHRLRIDR
jgi:mono/diheme cytochrome c family protein